MSLLRNGIDLSDGLRKFISGSRNLSIFVPYVKLQPLKELLEETAECRILVVRWELKDLLLGSSDLDVYAYCKSNNISLYRNSRLHLKAFIDGHTRCALGSANISARALNLPESEHFNYEIATVTENLSITDRLYFDVILNDSVLITDSIFAQIEAVVSETRIDTPEDMEFNIDSIDKHFLISSLPMSRDIPTLLQVLTAPESMNEIDLRCAIHDLALYSVPLGLTPNAARERLKNSFFSHPFIQHFVKNVEVEGFIYFGRAKDWIRKSCTSVPTPRKWELTENIQILYRWLVELGDGKYAVDVPGARSERLRVV